MADPPQPGAPLSVAKLIEAAFDEYRGRFKEISRQARTLFERRLWRECHADMVERLQLYGAVLGPLVAQIRRRLGDRIEERSVWAEIKARYSALVAHRETGSWPRPGSTR